MKKRRFFALFLVLGLLVSLLSVPASAFEEIDVAARAAAALLYVALGGFGVLGLQEVSQFLLNPRDILLGLLGLLYQHFLEFLIGFRIVHHGPDLLNGFPVCLIFTVFYHNGSQV